MATHRAWLRFSAVAVAALLGVPEGVVDVGLEALFSTLDASKKANARELCARAEKALIDLARQQDQGTVESARLTTESLLARFGLSEEAFAALGLNPDAAADAILARQVFAPADRIELVPLCRRLLVCFYQSVLSEPTLFDGLLPHIHQEHLRRLARIEAKQDRAQETLHAILTKITADKGIPLIILQVVLLRMGERDVPEDAAKIEARLYAKADEYCGLSSRLRRLTNDDPRVQELRREAADSLEKANSRLQMLALPKRNRTISRSLGS